MAWLVGHFGQVSLAAVIQTEIDGHVLERPVTLHKHAVPHVNHRRKRPLRPRVDPEIRSGGRSSFPLVRFNESGLGRFVNNPACAVDNESVSNRKMFVDRSADKK